MKKILFVLVTVMLVIISLFIIGEIMFRITKPIKPTVSMGVPHTIFHHFLKPSYRGKDVMDIFVDFTTNSEGFKNREFSIKKPQGVYRIVVLGDSFVFGTSVVNKDTFCSNLENMLNSKGEKRFEVINCGVGSYSPIVEYLLLKYKVIEYSPDLVMLFYDFGDLQDDFLYEKNALYDKTGELIACNPYYINGHFDYIQYARKYSYLFSYFYNKLSKFFERIQLLGLKKYLLCIIQGKRTKFALTEIDNLNSIKIDRFFVFRENTKKATIEHYWKNSAMWIDKIKGLLNKRNVEFILVAYPYGLQVSPTAWPNGRAVWNFQQNKLYDSKIPFEMFYDYSNREGVKFINLHPYLLRYNNERLYFEADGHWTATGNKRVAEGILRDPVFIETIK